MKSNDFNDRSAVSDFVIIMIEHYTKDDGAFGTPVVSVIYYRWVSSGIFGYLSILFQ